MSWDCFIKSLAMGGVVGGGGKGVLRDDRLISKPEA